MARVLLIPLVPELHAPRAIPLTVCVDTGVGALIVPLVVFQRPRGWALAALEGAHVAVEDGLIRVTSIIWRTALRRPHELVGTDIGRGPSARTKLLEGHHSELCLQLLRCLCDRRIAGLLGPEPVQMTLGLGMRSRLSMRSRHWASSRSSRRSGGNTTQVRGDILGSHCASQKHVERKKGRKEGRKEGSRKFVGVGRKRRQQPN